MIEATKPGEPIEVFNEVYLYDESKDPKERVRVRVTCVYQDPKLYLQSPYASVLTQFHLEVLKKAVRVLEATHAQQLVLEATYAKQCELEQRAGIETEQTP